MNYIERIQETVDQIEDRKLLTHEAVEQLARICRDYSREYTGQDKIVESDQPEFVYIALLPELDEKVAVRGLNLADALDNLEKEDLDYECHPRSYRILNS